MLPRLLSLTTLDRRNFPTALMPRSVSTQLTQMIAGKVTLALPHARQRFGRLTNVMPPLDIAIPAQLSFAVAQIAHQCST